MLRELLDRLLENPVFTGLSSASVFGFALYVLRGLPSAAWDFLSWRFTCSLTIFNEDAAYEKVNEWLSGLAYAKRCRKLRLTSRYDSDQQRDVDVLSPGLGKHLFWYRGRPVVVTRTLPDKGGIGGWKRFEDIEIFTLGSDPKVLQVLVDEIRDARNSVHGKTINVFLYRNRWRLACRKPKRDPESVVLPAGLKSELFDDIKRFLASRTWYQELGVPYRRGYVLEGPPGCGKTSLVLAVASHFERSIYALNLGSIANDDELIDAVCEVPENGILLIEDIDAAKAGAKRQSKPATVSDTPTIGTPEEPAREVSLSALLNVLDGAFSREGRVLFMTTNHPELIDPALLRAGRADCRFHIGPIDWDECLVMAERFIADKDEAWKVCASACPPVAASDLQERLVRARAADRRERLEAAE